MTVREFAAELNDLEQTIYDEKDFSTALQFLHRLISTTRDVADLLCYDKNIDGLGETKGNEQGTVYRQLCCSCGDSEA